ncbi:hypothetical protein [Siphonobacter sp. SORGH_AS_0500]|uniref:hypothetical protein n=1 Tax=Siphonobacter sp. SORGH_AS_0500 TaxID=1864824 RepID=UPI00285B2421|nr:hypothetical protein [Siphonobacter sp. SORGH_AS_0500]MDR6193326.1 hypothetical protein [Siphonobacter sp. SORGH_AS_0500]
MTIENEKISLMPIEGRQMIILLNLLDKSFNFYCLGLLTQGPLTAEGLFQKLRQRFSFLLVKTFQKRIDVLLALGILNVVGDEKPATYRVDPMYDQALQDLYTGTNDPYLENLSKYS